MPVDWNKWQKKYENEQAYANSLKRRGDVIAATKAARKAARTLKKMQALEAHSVSS